MPEGMFALFVFPFKKLYRGILTDWARNVPVLAIDLAARTSAANRGLMLSAI